MAGAFGGYVQPAGGLAVVLSGNIGSGQIGSGLLASGSVAGQGQGVFIIASGSLGNKDIASGGVWSGNIGSGLLAELVGLTRPTAEAISGFMAVCLGSGEVLLLANAASGLRLPAIGVVNANAASGDTVTAYRAGNQYTNLCSGWSGFVGKTLYAGSGGMVIGQSGLLSGMSWQRLGIALSGGIALAIDVNLTSGGVSVATAGANKF